MKKTILVVALVALVGCKGERGEAGLAGAQGARGDVGAAGMVGPAGAAGKDGAGTVDGSRLKVQYLVADDGARTPVGWLDTMTSAPCHFIAATDGQTRCIPSAPDVAIYFLDSVCDQIVGQTDTMPPPSYARGATPFNDYYYAQIGAPIAAPTGPLYITTGGGATCQAATSMPAAGFYSVTELPASFFVAAHVE